MKVKFFAFIFLVTSLIANGQTSPSYNSSEILQNIKKLNVTGSVLYIAAHPDDENTRLLSYLASEKKFRTVYISLTRGEGGQNLISEEIGLPLGMDLPKYRLLFLAERI